MQKMWIACACVCMMFSAAAADWPQFRGSARDGSSPEKDWSKTWPKEGPKQLWKASVGIGSSGLTVAGGKLYTLGWVDGKERVVCLDAGNGGELWSHSYAADLNANMHEGGPASTPTVDGKVVYTLGRDGELLALDAATGAVKWAQNLQKDHKAPVPFFGFTFSPLIIGEKLILPAGRSGMANIALNKTDGNSIWKKGEDPSAYASPQPFKHGTRTDVLILNGAALQLVDVDNGNELARFGFENPSPMNSYVNAASPLVRGNQIFISAAYGMGAALLNLDPAKPALEPRWKSDAINTQYASAVWHGDFVYGFNTLEQGESRGTFFCANAKDGAVVYTRDNPARGNLSLIGDNLLILSRVGELILAEANPKAWTELARVQITGSTCRTDPILVDGRIYARSTKGELFCFDVRK